MWMLEGWICCKRSALKRGSTVLNDLKLHTFSIVCPSISHPLVLTSLLSCLFTCYLPFPHLLNHLSTPGMEAILLPVDVRTSNSWGGPFFNGSCSRMGAWQPAGRRAEGLIWEARPSLNQHARRDNDSEPCALWTDKVPRHTPTMSVVLWEGTHPSLYVITNFTPAAHLSLPCYNPVLISPKAQAISYNVH